MKAGTPTTFRDKNGNDIKVGDRIKHEDGTIYTIDKFGRAVSVYGIVHALKDCKPIVYGTDGRGTYYTQLPGWELTDEYPAAPEGEKISPGDDIQNMAPPRVKDPRKLRKGARKTPPTEDELLAEQEAKAVAEGVTPEQAHAALILTELPDEVIADELRGRGFTGELTRIQTLKI